jgi:hypothetical protein
VSHNKPSRSLRVGEVPPEPKYFNW